MTASSATSPRARGFVERRGRELLLRPLSGNVVRLLLTSATILSVELRLIRWVSENIVHIGFFSDFLLMASFLGIGVGILLGRGGRRTPILPFALLLFVIVPFIWLVPRHEDSGHGPATSRGPWPVERSSTSRW